MICDPHVVTTLNNFVLLIHISPTALIPKIIQYFLPLKKTPELFESWEEEEDYCPGVPCIPLGSYQYKNVCRNATFFVSFYFLYPFRNS